MILGRWRRVGRWIVLILNLPMDERSLLSMAVDIVMVNDDYRSCTGVVAVMMTDVRRCVRQPPCA